MVNQCVSIILGKGGERMHGALSIASNESHPAGVESSMATQ